MIVNDIYIWFEVYSCIRRGSPATLRVYDVGAARRYLYRQRIYYMYICYIKKVFITCICFMFMYYIINIFSICICIMTSWKSSRPRPSACTNSAPPAGEEREFSIDNLLVRINFIIEMIWWTCLAPW